MTAFEFEQCRQVAEKWWPGITWTLDRDTIRDFDRITLPAGLKAIDALKDDNTDRYPNLAKYLRACKAAQGALPRPKDDPEHCRHRWAVASEVEIRIECDRQKRPDDGLRFATCVFCRTESWGDFGTVGEEEAA